MCVQFQDRALDPFRTGITDCCGQLWMLESDLGSLEEQLVLLTTEPCSQLINKRLRCQMLTGNIYLLQAQGGGAHLQSQEVEAGET